MSEFKEFYNPWRTLDEWVVLETAIATPYNAEENIKRGNVAMLHVISSHKMEPKAMFRKEIGWIGFEWGMEGEAPPDFKDHDEFREWQKSGRRPFDKGGHGIAHIIAKRDWEGKHIAQFKGRKSRDILGELVKAIACGDIATYGLKAKIQWQTIEIALAKKRTGGSEYWLLTGYVKPENGYTYVLESADAWGGVDDPALSPTHTRPTLDRPRMGAANPKHVLESADECASVTDHTTHLRMNGLHGFVQTWERQTQASKKLDNSAHEVNIGWLYDL